jgi:hypothetical protein
MKRIGIILIICLISAYSYSDSKITRGPNIGEIYFIGITYEGTGLYHSINFGENANCVDGINSILSITADNSQGGIYCIRMPSNLYYSENYGNANSWIVKNGGISVNIESGINIGHIFSNFYSHSEDFGLNFTYHSCNGYFGDVKEFGIDKVNDSNGYVFSVKLTNADTSYLFRTFDKFENVEVIQKIFFPNGQTKFLFCGNDSGEVFTYFRQLGALNYSVDFAENFQIIDQFNFSNYYSFDLVSGRQIGEIYILYNFVNLGWLNAHTYIFHSTDLGKTFEVYHPFSKGNEPVLANFSTVEKEVLLTTPIEFLNFSIGDIQEYQWDFENDGVIDSYEESATHTYQDTGYYSVKLSVVGQDSTNTFIKENYIHVIDTITGNHELDFQTVNISPNPFNDKISFETKPGFKSIEIFDLNGKLHFSKTLLQEHKTEILDLRELEKGIYILKIKIEGQNITKKIIKI